jgi:transposase
LKKQNPNAPNPCAVHAAKAACTTKKVGKLALTAHVLVSKFDDHLPLYRQNEIFARLGADIPDSTLVDWCGRACQVLAPLADRIATKIMASDLLHADDTPIRVLDRSLRDKGRNRPVGTACRNGR